MSRAQAHPCRDGGCNARPSVTLSHASPQPARRLRRVLAEQRENRKEFNTAWPAAVAAATAGLDHDERLAWARAFDATAAGVGGLLALSRAGAAACHPGRLTFLSPRTHGHCRFPPYLAVRVFEYS